MLLSLALTGGMAAGVSACKPIAEADPRVEAPLVRVATVRPAGAAERAFTGVISARVQSNLGFRVGGKVVERLVDTGQPVALGQPLMKLDRTDLELAIAARNNAIEAARAVAVQARADEVRYRDLVAKGWVSNQRYELARSARDNADAQLAAAEATAQVAKNEGDYAVLLADADGVVVETLAEPGQVVAAGQTVVRLAHAGPREATVSLPEGVRPSIGSEATATLYGNGSSSSNAYLRQLSDAADPATRTYEARYVLEGAAARAPLGATVTIRMPEDASSRVVEVPLGALFDNGTATGVWLIDPNTPVIGFRGVKVHELRSEQALISQGLESGDQVVALGAHLLHEGARVRIVGTEAVSR
ncbi:hemolysin secretion protein D [Hyphomicrobium nitrativorans NL23]|uniref:Hemolysin secretion protein D n=1 Tax=Hyphomicrobium nitrativorans NL23 TaxID=1029756 RepID=V5SAQ2_9HYPH|nr:hemolysin secretion protein D [Hyphomicrobium nitrativorans NL23]